MKEQRMTIEELRELEEAGKLPVTLKCDDGYYDGCFKEMEVIFIAGRCLGVIDASGDANGFYYEEGIRHYPSLKEEPKTEWLYECIGRVGETCWHFLDGKYPIIDNGEVRKSKSQDLNMLNRATGRKVKVNMETFEPVREMVND